MAFYGLNLPQTERSGKQKEARQQTRPTTNLATSQPCLLEPKLEISTTESHTYIIPSSLKVCLRSTLSGKLRTPDWRATSRTRLPVPASKTYLKMTTNIALETTMVTLLLPQMIYIADFSIIGHNSSRTLHRQRPQSTATHPPPPPPPPPH
jgi:hypothetical protein